MSAEKLKDHLVVDVEHHRAVRSVAAEKKMDMTEYVHSILDLQPEIYAAIKRIRSHED